MVSRSALWRWALWFGVLTGLTQALLVAVARVATHRLIFSSSDDVWMAPLADAGVFVLAALVLQSVAWRVRPPIAMRTALWLFLFLFLIGPLLVAPRLHVYAALLVAAGAAVQIARILDKRQDGFATVVRRTVLALVCLSAALGLGMQFSRSLSERRVVASSSPAGPGTPNVILIVLDTVRAQNLSLYGYSRRTSPRLDSFAERGVVFERAFSTSPWTLPSHASMFTGRFPHELSADWLTPLDATHPTLAQEFRRRGYATAGFVGNLLYAPRETGLSRGFARYEDYPRSVRTLISTSWLTRRLIGPMRRWTGDPDRFVRKNAGEVSDEFLAWLDAQPAKPFFAFLNYFDAHAPYVSPRPFDTMFGEGDSPPETDITTRRSWSKQQIQRSMDAYDGTIAYLDQEVGRLLDRVNAKGLARNTLILITSDHGEQFGEHGLFDHANSLYRQVLQVPLVIAFPGQVPPGIRLADPVSLADLSATILDLALGSGASPSLPGRSLADSWSKANKASGGPAALLAEVSQGINTDPWLPFTKGPMKSVVVEGMHYIRHSDGQEELYDFDRDIAETEDLSTRAGSGSLLDRSRRALDALLTDSAHRLAPATDAHNMAILPRARQTPVVHATAPAVRARHF